MKTVLITGAAGFIGYHLARKLINEGYSVDGVDSINDYYDVGLKLDRLREMGILVSELRDNRWTRSKKDECFRFRRMDLADFESVQSCLKDSNYDMVVHLAAQPGVRYSIENPHAYIQSNLVGYVNLLEALIQVDCKKLIYASSSSVYGERNNVPFSEKDNVDKPISLYAATKKSNELIANSYKEIHGLKSIGLRFFTAYGPWGRPDMAPMIFANKILKGESIDLFNYGNQLRDFTFISDLVSMVSFVIDHFDEMSEPVINIASGNPTNLLDFVNELEKSLKIEAKKNLVPSQPGDVSKTFASIEVLRGYGYNGAKTSLDDGVLSFASWFMEYVGTVE